MAKHLYLMPPLGYVITELIPSTKIERLRSLAKEMVRPDDPKIDEFNKVMDKASLADLQKFLKLMAMYSRLSQLLKRLAFGK
jgi:hypothetical protein